MSAIAGITGVSPDSAETAAATMRGALNFVRADREATWRGEGCVIVTKRLVIDERDWTAPLLQPSAAGVVVAIEGHLFNRPEIAAAVGLPVSSDDEALVACAWEKWGDAFPSRLNGEFAIAAWDPGTGRLLLANDHLATVPLYYASDAAGRVAFGTELSSIVAAMGMRPEPDWNRIAEYLARSHGEEERTFLAGVSAVPVGGVAVFSAAGKRAFHYWDYATVVPTRIRGQSEGVEAFRAALHRAVARRLSAVGAVGSHLTGGLDSSAVAAMAANVLGDAKAALHLFSIVARPPDDPKAFGDANFIPAFVRMYPECPHAYVLGRMEENYPLPGIPNGPIHLELSAAIAEVAVRATASGARVMLTGYGGEAAATYMGFGVYWAALQQGCWPWLLQELRAAGGGWARLRWCRRSLVGERRLRTGRLRDIRWQAARANLAPEFLAEYRMRQRCRQPDRLPVDPVIATQTEQLLGLRIRGRLASWAHQGRTEGLRYRYPLLDRELLELVRGLDPHVHRNAGRRRELMRLAMHRLLPQEIVGRTDKAGALASNQLADRQSESWRAMVRTAWPYIEGIVTGRENDFADMCRPEHQPVEEMVHRQLRGGLVAVGNFLSQLARSGSLVPSDQAANQYNRREREPQPFET